MEDSVNYAEYTVSQKSEGAYKRKRILLILSYIAVGLIELVVFVGILKIWPLGMFVPISIAILYYFTWNNVEHKYEVVNAKFRVSKTHGKRMETVFEALVSEFSLIAPMTDDYRDQWEKADKILDYRSSKKTPDSYFARLEKDGTTTVVYFEAINKMLKVMKFYNAKATVVTTMRY